MKINDTCEKCLLDKQMHRANAQADAAKRAFYMEKVREILDAREEEDVSALMVYRFNKVFHELFGEDSFYGPIKEDYNNYVLSMEEGLTRRIRAAEDPLVEAFLISRIGNYIDFGAMNHVDKDKFLSLFEGATLSERDRQAYADFLSDCEKGKRFLLIADNCGEIVLDKLFVRELKKRFPHLDCAVMVRGGEILNDVTIEDAQQSGMDKEAKIVPNGVALAGTIYQMITPEAREALDHADIILAKGQGNYESLSGQGRHIYYSFLCKCELFVKMFGEPLLTAMLVEE